MFKIVILIFTFLFSTGLSRHLEDNDYLPMFINGRPKGGMLGNPKVEDVGQLTYNEPQWFTQTLDHFNDADIRTWKQKYYVNATFWKKDGPVFLMIGGEGPLSPLWVSVGSMVKDAMKYGALVFALEHRFYGESHPLSDTSLASLRYLSSEQALADIVTYYEAMSDQFAITDNNRLIVFGGSYPGGLAAWFRYKYPHLAYGAIATSAPIHAQLNFPQYLEVASNSLSDDKCRTNVKSATDAFESFSTSIVGLKLLSSKFKTCKPLILSSNDIPYFASTVAGNFFGVIQYNRDNRAFEGALGTNVTIDTLCDIMNNEQIGDELERYATVNNLLMKTYGLQCIDVSYEDYVTSMRRTSWGSAATEGGRQWMYQTCTEFGYYQTTDSTGQVFGTLFPLSFSLKQCADIFDTQFNASNIRRGIDWTNGNYGSYFMSAKRIVFPNGSIDPWHALSFTKSGKEIVAIYIKGTAHCANMYPSSEADTPELITAREQISSIIGDWLSQSNS